MTGSRLPHPITQQNIAEPAVKCQCGRSPICMPRLQKIREGVSYRPEARRVIYTTNLIKSMSQGSIPLTVFPAAIVSRSRRLGTCRRR